MGTSVISGGRGGYFRVISDGEKIILLSESTGKRKCYLYTNPFLTAFSMKIDRPIHRFESLGGDCHYEAGLIDYNVELSFRGGEVRNIDHPLVMGVDIFDHLSVTDYLDIINEKIKGR
jgi:hypothetical protein